MAVRKASEKPADVSSIVFETKRIKAIVTSQRSGIARLLGELTLGSGSVEVKSTHFNKFADESEVECVFRVRTDGSNQLVSANLLDKDARYQVFVTDLVPDQANVLADILVKEFSYTPDEIIKTMELIGKIEDETSEGIAPITPALTYDEVRSWETYFSQALPGSSITYHKASKGARAHGNSSTVSIVAAVPARRLPDVPEWIDGHWLSADERVLFGMAANIVNHGDHLNLLLKGPSGYGKTSKLEALGKHLGLPVVIMDCSTVLDTESWFGYQEARDGSTIFIPTSFTEAIERGNAVVILDEVNRVEPILGNSLFPVLDHRRRTNIHGRDIAVGPGVIFGMTINFGIKYAGTHVMDAALTNRIDMGIEVGAMPQKVEAKAITTLFKDLAVEAVDQILALVTELRKVVEKNMMESDVSTRTSMKLALAMTNGMTLQEAAKFVVVLLAPAEERKILQDAINLTTKGGSRP